MPPCTACSSVRTTLKSWLEARWYSAAPPSLALRPLAALYGALSAQHRAAQSAAAIKLPLPVIVAGNLSVGGTGKTPVTIWLVERLREWGWKPGIISRGYGGHSTQYPLCVDVNTPPLQCGDEPALMARRLACPLAVAPDRVAAARLLIESGEVNVLVSDDGLQHYRLHRDLEFCVVDGVRGLGNAALLPAGPLREPPARLREMNFVFINGGTWCAPEGIAHARFTLRMGEVQPLLPGASRPLSAFSEQRVHAVAGIGNPQRFFDQLTAQGLQVIPHAFDDHQAYAASDLAFGDGLPVLMTEKDAVKCAAFAQAQHWQVPVDMQFEEAASAAVRKLIEPLKVKTHG